MGGLAGPLQASKGVAYEGSLWTRSKEIWQIQVSIWSTKINYAPWGYFVLCFHPTWWRQGTILEVVWQFSIDCLLWHIIICEPCTQALWRKEIGPDIIMLTADFSCVEKSRVACFSRKIVWDYYRPTECEHAARTSKSERAWTVFMRRLYFRTLFCEGHAIQDFLTPINPLYFIEGVIKSPEISSY